jgi:hypothetical protein
MRFSATNAAAVVIKQLGVMTSRAKSFHQAARLPVRPVIDTLMKGEDADFFGANGHARPMPARDRGSDLQRACAAPI